MDWVALIDLILALIEKCSKADSPDEVFNVMRRGGVRVGWQVHRLHRQAGKRGEQLKMAINETMEAIHSATDQELRDLIDYANTEFPG